MDSKAIREWTGIQQFPPATQTKMLELLRELKDKVLFYTFDLNLLLEVEGHVNICLEHEQAHRE